MKYYRDGYSKAWICQAMQVTRQWLNKWIKRWIDGGRSWKALDNSPPIPKTIHKKRDTWKQKILELKNRFPHYGAQKLKLVGGIPLSHTTLHRVLQENGACERKKRTWRKYRRFARPFANYLWQMDFCQVPTKKEGWVYIGTLLDDHSRFVIASRSYKQYPTAADAIHLVKAAVRQWGAPRQILTDRGNQFTHEGDTPSLFTQVLEDHLGIEHLMGRPHHPRTQGKIERWHRSLKHEWFYRNDVQPDREAVRRLLDGWVEHYNLERPHWALKNQVPMEIFLGSLIISEDLARAVNEVPG